MSDGTLGQAARSPLPQPPCRCPSWRDRDGTILLHLGPQAAETPARHGQPCSSRATEARQAGPAHRGTWGSGRGLPVPPEGSRTLRPAQPTLSRPCHSALWAAAGEQARGDQHLHTPTQSSAEKWWLGMHPPPHLKAPGPQLPRGPTAWPATSVTSPCRPPGPAHTRRGLLPAPGALAGGRCRPGQDGTPRALQHLLHQGRPPSPQACRWAAGRGTASRAGRSRRAAGWGQRVVREGSGGCRPGPRHKSSCWRGHTPPPPTRTQGAGAVGSGATAEKGPGSSEGSPRKLQPQHREPGGQTGPRPWGVPPRPLLAASTLKP